MVFVQNRDLPVITIHAKPIINRDTRKLILYTFWFEPPNQNFWNLDYSFLGCISTELIWGYKISVF